MQYEEVSDRIRKRAHQLWEEAGRPDGSHLEHWLQAEKELLLNSAAVAPLTDAAQQVLSGANAEKKPAGKTKTESSAPKASKKSSGRSKNK